MRNSITNLGDIAKMAGVSKSTVSKALTNKSGNAFSVKKEVRQHIIEVAKQLKYKSNLISHGLTKRRTSMISVLGGSHALSNLGNIYQSVINSITSSMNDNSGDFDVTVDMSHHAPNTSELPAWKIDGAIILAHCSKETYEDLEQRAVPYIVVNGNAVNGSSVIPDDIQGMSTVIEHLVSLGHKRIAYATAPLGHLEGHSSIQNRHDTYVSEISRLGLPLIEGHEIPMTSATIFLKMAVISQKATAVIAYGHMNALNIIEAAQFLNIAIPKQLSLIAFCDQYAADIMSPSLTFVDLRAKEMGKIAAEMLVEKIKKPDENETRNIKLQEKLVFRSSTSKPPAELQIA